jgi:manganese efflux pump family protein
VTATALLKVVVVAASLGLDVFAVSIGVGMRGADRWLKVRIGFAFSVAEITMTLAGCGLGALAGRLIGDFAGDLGFAALVCVGIYMVVETRRESAEGLDLSRGVGLMLAALSTSLDSLGIGFSILYIGVPLVVSLVCIGLVSVLSTTLGLALGRALGRHAEETAALWAGLVLIATGLGFAALKHFGHG